MTGADTIEWNTDNHNRQVDEIRREVERRFWVLKMDEQLQWHYVEDQLGRRLSEPMILPSLRGWLKSLPPQA